MISLIRSSFESFYCNLVSSTTVHGLVFSFGHNGIGFHATQFLTKFVGLVPNARTTTSHATTSPAGRWRTLPRNLSPYPYKHRISTRRDFHYDVVGPNADFANAARVHLTPKPDAGRVGGRLCVRYSAEVFNTSLVERA